jgi:hypothetical protein
MSTTVKKYMPLSTFPEKRHEKRHEKSHEKSSMPES